MNDNLLGGGSSEDPQLYVEGKMIGMVDWGSGTRPIEILHSWPVEGNPASNPLVLIRQSGQISNPAVRSYQIWANPANRYILGLF